jgi:glycine oxidase
VSQSRSGQPTTPPSPDVLIVGGGIIGCASAYYLTLAGASVVVVEREHLAAGASGVAAGMLAPQVEGAFEDPFFDLTLRGRAEHPPLAAALRDETGLDVELQATGIIRVAENESDRADLQRRFKWQSARGLPAEWIEPGDLGRIEPLLGGAVGHMLAGGVWFPEEGHVRGARLVQALAAASVKRGARFVEGAGVGELLRDGDRITGVRSSAGATHAATTLLAAGVGSGDLARTAGLSLPVGPVKGQIIALRALNRMPRHVIWSGDCYLVPKVDAQVILGATIEDGNYDRRPTLAGLGALSEAALEFLPWAGQLVVEGIWAGLRPAAPDRFPIIGRAPGLAGLVIATAHYRNGILLGPLTGRWIADLILKDQVAPELGWFGPERFAKPE